MSGVVPVILLDVRDQKYRYPLLLPHSLQDPSLADTAPGDVAGGVGLDVHHPLTERGDALPGS